MKKVVEWVRANRLATALIALGSIWILDLVIEQYVRGWESGLTTPGGWWFDLKPAEAAAWAQAVGTVLAVMVAIWVPYHLQRVRDQREAAVRAVRAKAARLLIRTTLKRLFQELRVATGAIGAVRHGPGAPVVMRLTSKVDLIPRVEACWDQVMYLDEREALEFTNVLSTARDYQTSIERLVAAAGQTLRSSVVKGELDFAISHGNACADAAEQLHNAIVENSTRRHTFEVTA